MTDTLAARPRRKDEAMITIPVVTERCAGIDVGKRGLAVARLTSPAGKEGLIETRWFGTTVPELESLKNWIMAAGVTTVAMESTDSYWIPVKNVLESDRHVVLVCSKKFAGVVERMLSPVASEAAEPSLAELNADAGTDVARPKPDWRKNSRPGDPANCRIGRTDEVDLPSRQPQQSLPGQAGIPGEAD